MLERSRLKLGQLGICFTNPATIDFGSQRFDALYRDWDWSKLLCMDEKNTGSSFDSWLREDGIYDEVTANAEKRVKARMSKPMSALHENVSDLYRVGMIDEKTMREFDSACLTPDQTSGQSEREAILDQLTLEAQKHDMGYSRR
jgi:hypothetical protein